MAEPIVDPTADRPYLEDANYFRLGYQLAAQLMHREESGEKKGAIYELVSDILHGDRKYPEPNKVEARRQAERFIADGETVLDWYCQRREKRRFGLFRRRLSFKEERLEEFLRRTVQPCLTIVAAASRRGDDPAGAEARIAPLRRGAAINEPQSEDDEVISYRAIYNLACFEAEGGDDANHERALLYLATALDRVRGSRRKELGKWAQKDPSLRALQELPAFKELLEPFA